MNLDDDMITLIRTVLDRGLGESDWDGVRSAMGLNDAQMQNLYDKTKARLNEED